MTPRPKKTLKPKTTKPQRGRPPGGHNGALVSEYQRFTLRMDPQTFALINAWAATVKRPAYLIISEAIVNGVDKMNPPAVAHRIRSHARVRHDVAHHAKEKARG